MSESPIIYISKRCEYCIELIKILNQRNDIKGNFSIISIDEEPFPNYIKEVRESDLLKPGDDDIIDKLLEDFASNNLNVTREEIIQKFNQYENNVKEEMIENN